MIARTDVKDVGSDGLHDAGSLMTEYERSIGRPLARGDVQVRVAHTTCAQPHPHEISPDLGEI